MELIIRLACRLRAKELERVGILGYLSEFCFILLQSESPEVAYDML